MRLLSTCGLMVALAAVPTSAQETGTIPNPTTPAPKVQQQDSAQGSSTQNPAPVERRATKPTANPTDSVAGPLPGAGTPARPASAPERTGDDVDVLHVQSRLVNIALNVVDEHGMPVGGFERGEFQIFENGAPQQMAVFERESTSPLSIVLAIDASETVLTSERLEREAAKRFIRGILRPQDQLCLMDFSDTVREIVPFTNEPKRVQDGLSEIRRGEETALFDAVYLASNTLSESHAGPNARRVLVVISDGGDSARHSRYSEAIEQAQRAGAMIFSIIIVPVAADAGRNTGGEHTMIQMSEDTGGKYYYVTDPADLEPAFRHVSEDLRAQYLLGYYAPLAGGQGFRRIRVTLKDPAQAAKFQLRYRTGYYADSK